MLLEYQMWTKLHRTTHDVYHVFIFKNGYTYYGVSTGINSESVLVITVHHCSIIYICDIKLASLNGTS